MITDEDLALAWDRVARTPDGEMIYLWLQRITMGGVNDPNPTDGALRASHGRRSLAHEIRGLMAKGIEESGGRSGDSIGDQRGERPVVFSARQPIAIGRGRNFRDWARTHDPELRKPVPGDD